MSIPKIPEGEYRFCLIMWEHEPVSSLDLVKLCQERLGWKRTTTYTVIKRLGERGVLKLENGLVTALISKEEQRRQRSIPSSRPNSAALCRPSSPPSPSGRIYPTETWTRFSG